MQFLLLVCFLTFSSLRAKILEEEHVLVLTNENFDEALKQHKHILVEFYAPWCGHCQTLAPEYAKAATQLTQKKSEIKLAKVDATIEKDLAERFKVQGYPTIKFFSEGNVIEYGGGHNAEGILSWITKKLGPPCITINSIEQAKKFIDSHDVVVIGFFKGVKSPGVKEYETTAKTSNEAEFGLTTNPEVFSYYGVEANRAIVLFKKFDEGRNNFEGEYDSKLISEFVKHYNQPLITEFNRETASHVFGGDVKMVLIAALPKKAAYFSVFKQMLENVAKNFRGKVIFVSLDSTESDSKQVLDYFAIKPEDVPTLRIVNLDNNDMTKFKPQTDDLSEINVDEFVSNVLSGKQKPYRLSQDLPADWDKNPVKVLVVSNFHKITKDVNKAVLVEFYAPWCGSCQKIAPIYDQLGEAYKNHKEIVIAKMDATANELEDIKIMGYPTIKYFPKGSDKVIDYAAAHTLVALKAFLDSDGKENTPKKDESAEDSTEDKEKGDKKEEL